MNTQPETRNPEQTSVGTTETSAPGPFRRNSAAEFIAQHKGRVDKNAPGLPDAHRVMPAATEDDWEQTAVDITRLDKTDPANKAAINNAWRRLKTDAPDEAAHLAELFPRLRAHFPGAGIQVPADTLEQC